MTPRDIMIAQFARADDPSAPADGRCPATTARPSHHVLSTSSPVATQLLHAVGIALAAKIRGTGQVALTELGEGSSNQGDFHEGLNFAGIHHLPVVFVVENNGYAISVPMALRVGRADIAMRAAGYAMPGVVVDGGDVLACYRAGREAIDRARRGDGPTLIEAKVMRLTAHSSDDQQTKYRSAGGAGAGAGARPAAQVPGSSSGPPACWTTSRRRRSRRRSRPPSRTRPTGRRRSRSRIPPTALRHVYAEPEGGRDGPPDKREAIR